MRGAHMRQPVLRVKGPRASKVVALWTSRARRDSQASAATRLRAMLRERRPRWPETIRRQASAGEAPGDVLCMGWPSPPPGVCGRGPSATRSVSNKIDSQKGRAVGPPLRACFASVGRLSRGPGHEPSARARRRMPRPASRAYDGASTRPPAARQLCPCARPEADFFPCGSGIGRLRSAVDLRRPSARQPMMRR